MHRLLSLDLDILIEEYAVIDSVDVSHSFSPDSGSLIDSSLPNQVIMEENSKCEITPELESPSPSSKMKKSLNFSEAVTIVNSTVNSPKLGLSQSIKAKKRPVFVESNENLAESQKIIDRLKMKKSTTVIQKLNESKKMMAKRGSIVAMKGVSLISSPQKKLTITQNNSSINEITNLRDQVE